MALVRSPWCSKVLKIEEEETSVIIGAFYCLFPSPIPRLLGSQTSYYIKTQVETNENWYRSQKMTLEATSLPS